MKSLHRFVHVILIIGLILVGAALVPLKLFDSNGFSRIEKLSQELSELEEAKIELRRENELLRTQIQAFHSDPNYIEKVARDDLGMVGPHEVVYQFPSTK